MRTALSAIAIALVSLGSNPAEPVFGADIVQPGEATVLAQSQWSTLHSEEGRFTVDFPASPTLTQASTNVLNTSLAWEIQQTQVGDRLFAVAYTDLPLELLEAGQTAVLESVQSQLLADDFNWSTLVSNSREVPLENGLSGREFTSINQGNFSTLRVFLVKRRLYLVFAIADDIAQSVRFLDSFTVDDIWTRYHSTEGGFSVSVPLTPIATTESTEIGDLSLTWQKVVARNIYDIDDRFAVAYTDVPEALSADDFTAIAETVIADLADANLIATENLAAAGYDAGLEFVGSTAARQPMILRFYQVDNRIYATFARSFSSTRLDRFINSFTLAN